MASRARISSISFLSFTAIILGELLGLHKGGNVLGPLLKSGCGTGVFQGWGKKRHTQGAAHWTHLSPSMGASKRQQFFEIKDKFLLEFSFWRGFHAGRALGIPTWPKVCSRNTQGPSTAPCPPLKSQQILVFFHSHICTMPIALGDLHNRLGLSKCYLLTVMNNNYGASAIWILTQKGPV